MTPLETYFALKARILASGVEIEERAYMSLSQSTYQQRPKPVDRGDGIWYQPQIAPRILAPPPTTEPSEVEALTCTLAHEFGHHLGLEEEAPGVRELFNRRTIDMESWRLEPLRVRQGAVDAERRAWNYARAELARLGFCSWAVFSQQSEAAIASYVDGLPGVF